MSLLKEFKKRFLDDFQKNNSKRLKKNALKAFITEIIGSLLQITLT